ncbi:MAG: uroporphyrinogen decarboxylase [Verrucomicrobia bacterium]|nr:uroporphyrinogen decarboxylase [Verrucomicrobiota bacterium]
MTLEQWKRLAGCARGDDLAAPPVALIVDSPWIPGYLGLSTLDYLSLPEVWLEANLRVVQEYPDIAFLPGFWLELGMGAEPSGFGCKLTFYADSPPAAHAIAEDIRQLDRLTVPNPHADGLMPWLLNYYRRLEPRVNEAGQRIKMVAARGPLATASHLLGVSSFLLGLKLEPAATHRLLRTTTALARHWLEAQAGALREVEAILVLDDLAGFLSPKDYLEFAHPYLREIFAAFPGVLKVFHDDTDNVVPFPHLRDLGIDAFNFTHLQPLDKVRKLVGPELCLMGNVPPLEVLAQGTPDQVQAAVRACLAAHGGGRRLWLSAGGGVSPGTPAANLRALVTAARGG